MNQCQVQTASCAAARACLSLQCARSSPLSLSIWWRLRTTTPLAELEALSRVQSSSALASGEHQGSASSATITTSVALCYTYIVAEAAAISLPERCSDSNGRFSVYRIVLLLSSPALDRAAMGIELSERSMSEVGIYQRLPFLRQFLTPALIINKGEFSKLACQIIRIN